MFGVYMARTRRLWPAFRGASVRSPLRVRLGEANLSVEALSVAASKKKSPQAFSPSHTQLCLETSHGADGHRRLFLPGAVQKVRAAETLAVGSVPAISGGPKRSCSVCFRWDQNGYSAAGLD